MQLPTADELSERGFAVICFKISVTASMELIERILYEKKYQFQRTYIEKMRRVFEVADYARYIVHFENKICYEIDNTAIVEYIDKKYIEEL
jgi:hypothetical protein